MTDSPPDGIYELDPSSTELRFRAKGFGLLPVSGTLPAVTGEVRIAGGRLTAHGTGDATALRTGIKPRDMHVKHKHFMHVAEHPSVELAVDDAALAGTVTAQLTVRGETVELPLTLRGLRVEGDVLRVVAEGDLDRKPLGMKPWGVSRRIGLELDVTATRRD